MLKKLFVKADIYVSQSNWKDMALLKFCLCAIGVMIGISIDKEHKKQVGIVAFLVFLVTYIPLMKNFIPILMEDDE